MELEFEIRLCGITKCITFYDCYSFNGVSEHVYNLFCGDTIDVREFAYVGCTVSYFVLDDSDQEEPIFYFASLSLRTFSDVIDFIYYTLKSYKEFGII